MPGVRSLRVCSRPARWAGRLTKRYSTVDAHDRRMPHRVRGQAIVEFCLVAMLFFTLLFAILDFGMLLNDWISVTTAASAGARRAAVGACLEGPAATPATCVVQNGQGGETSVVGTIMESAPLLATGGDCQNPPLPLNVHNQCASRLSIALVDLMSVQGAYCRDVELWVNNQTNVRTLTLQPITSGWTGEPCSATTLILEANDALTVVVRARVELPISLPALPTDTYVESSGTVRFEGVYVQ
jgi:hypothetical protein